MHLEDLERQSGVRPPELDGPDCPQALAYLWTWFCELSNVRGGGMGLAPIGWSEMQAWCAVTRRELTRLECQALGAMDRRFLEVMAAK